MKAMISAATLAVAVGTGAPAAHAADCHLADTVQLKLYATQPSDLFVEQAAPVAAPSYKLGEAVTAKPGDVLLKRKVTMVGQLASFAQDVVYKSSMPFSTTYALKAGEQYPLLQIPRGPGIYAISVPIKEGSDDWVFLNADGQLCEKPMVYERWHDFLTYRTGSYKGVPDVAATIRNANADGIADSADGDTVIVEHIDAAAIDLSLRRSVGGKMGEAQKGSFAISSKQIEFGGYKLRVDAVSPEALTVAVVGEPPLQ